MWLEATTRVTKSWAVYDETSVSKLTFKWPHGGQQYSYDLGGLLFGGDFDNQFFLAESKKYKGSSDQGTHYDKFLAQSYVTLRDQGRLADHFMWITWAPFRVTSWSKQSDPDAIRKALLTDENRARVFGDVDVEAAKTALDDVLLLDLSSRMWIIVLSERQERLVISDEDRGVLLKRRVKKGMM